MLAADPAVTGGHGQVERRALRGRACERGAAVVERSGETRLGVVECASRFAALLGREGAERLLEREDLTAAIAEELDARGLEGVGVGGSGQRGDAACGDVVGGALELLARGVMGILGGKALN
jgi:hypothetical protein